MINAWTATVPGTAGLKWTKRLVLQNLAMTGAHPRAVGSPTTVADLLQKWIDEAGIDGFNFSYATTPHTFEDMIKYLWPELKRRGVLQTEYVGSTMRENYLMDYAGPLAREGHPAARLAKTRTKGKPPEAVVGNGKKDPGVQWWAASPSLGRPPAGRDSATQTPAKVAADEKDEKAEQEAHRWAAAPSLGRLAPR